MVSDRDTGKQVYCAVTTKSGQNCRNAADKSGYCGKHRPEKASEIDFYALNFKELLAACPLEGVEVSRGRH